MILRIEQTRAGTAQTFDVYTGDRLVFTGRLGAVSKRQEIVLEGKNGQRPVSYTHLSSTCRQISES